MQPTARVANWTWYDHRLHHGGASARAGDGSGGGSASSGGGGDSSGPAVTVATLPRPKRLGKRVGDARPPAPADHRFGFRGDGRCGAVGVLDTCLGAVAEGDEPAAPDALANTSSQRPTPAASSSG